ncbi:hypothetical protein Rsub_04164 [Raphidocelis subcapitata]|uniref:Uncharacterized protein n=1 Tax=Raphidocelis subcapitata TaxID=307507 RepID=A0A2V0NUW1_9CHLO|nr:hypothetical protein Rsub_04164 [Raphidocelis subcapitata]|eukprot:GBF91424.1 hypothetical protein Rsub_04164 [Raphidocelis subcapitata]
MWHLACRFGRDGAAAGLAAGAAAAAPALARHLPPAAAASTAARPANDACSAGGGCSSGGSASDRASSSAGAGPSSAAAAPGGASPRRAVHIITHGCQMNVSDSELVARLLSDSGYDPRAASVEAADAVLINTCAIREGAEARIWGKLAQLRDVKRARRKEGGDLVVGVLGCMAERLKRKLLDSDKLADLVVGPDAYRDLPRVLEAVRAGAAGGPEAMSVALSLDETYADVVPLRAGGGPAAFVSIMRGCNNMCSFCIVPHTRGRERSRPADSILREVEGLLREGVREVTLLGQNVNSYAYAPPQGGGGGGGSGMDAAASSGAGDGPSCSGGEAAVQREGPPAGADPPGAAAAAAARFYAPGFSSVYAPSSRAGAVRFAQLLSSVAGLDPELRVRFTSPHPKDFSDEVLEVVASTPNIARHLHMPAQSGSTTMLARMRRGHTREAYDALVARARAAVPGVALSTDIICGFCGETDEEHAATLDLLRSTRYDSAFLFAYSRRDKTHAARHYEDDVPEATKALRLQEAFEAYREGQRQLLTLQPGALHLVLLEGPARKGEGMLTGRTCSNKRVVFRDGPLPAALDDLRRAAEAASGGGGGVIGGGGFVYRGPFVQPRPGEYVACLVREVVSGATLLATPLARTSAAAFVAEFGGTLPGRGAGGWVAAAGAAAEAAEAAAAAGSAPRRCEAAAAFG